MISEVFRELFGDRDEIVIFGTGSTSSEFLTDSGLEPSFFVDNNASKWGTSFFGKTVFSPEKLNQQNKRRTAVIVCSMYYADISRQLKSMGWTEEENFWDCEQVRYLCLSGSRARGDMLKIRYPRIINYSVTNECHYQSVVRNDWRPEYAAHKDMTPEEIERLFRKPLFRYVEHVEFSGGEPFVRNDMEEIVERVVAALPSLRSISFISNGSLETMVNRAARIREMLREKQIEFSLQISIDGVGDIHNANRSVKNAFERTYQNFRQLNSLGLVTEISTTITRKNVRRLWEMYRFAREHNVYIRFRLATEINRLYNHDLVPDFALTEEEKLLVIKFLENVVHHYEKKTDKKILYVSLIEQLKGHKRTAGCFWQTSEGLSLDPYGNLYFCFPKSSVVHNINDDIPYDLELLQRNEPILDQALTCCDHCTHDYFGPVLPEGARLLYERAVEVRKNREKNTIELHKPNTDYRISSRTESDWSVHPGSRVAIIGWYGTETLGDKAILGGIISNFNNSGIRPDQMTVVSLHKTLTQLTMYELGLPGIPVVDIREIQNHPSFYMEHDLFVFGGGPLCDVEPMIDMLAIFRQAKLHGKRTMIYGCGIGPLHDARYIQALKKLLDLTDRACFRDRISIDKYESILRSVNPDMSYISFIDPAAAYIQSLHTSAPPLIEGDYILFCLRKWPRMYAGEISDEMFLEKSGEFDNKMKRMIGQLLAKGKQVVLFPMHTYYVGLDDREYYLDLLKDEPFQDRVRIIGHDYTPAEAVNYFRHAKMAICMRFHSVVFSIACNTPCVAIDYDYGSGKVTGFLNVLGLEHLVFPFEKWLQADPAQVLRDWESISIHWHDVNRRIFQLNRQMHAYMMNGTV